MKNVMAMFTVLAVSSLAVAGDNMDRQQSGVQKIDEDFKALDSNGDNYISSKEASEKSIRNHFSAIDLDRNQHISKEEFNNYVARYPSMVEEDVMEEAE